jgi:hypothetical protein
MHMTKKLSGIFAALALAAAPGVAQAHQPDGHGHGLGHAPGQQSRGTEHSGQARGHAKHHRTTRARVAYVAKGTVKAIDVAGETITITVADRRGATNRWARDWRGTDVTFDVSDARLKVRDVNGDGERNLADVAVGDIAKVLAKLPRVLPAQQSSDEQPTAYKAKRVTVRHPSTETQAPETGDQQPEQEPAAPTAS